jgi:outer membrane lipoprotein-sorting protein
MLMHRLAAVPARTATFQEQKTVAALSAPIEDSGTLAYTRPSSLEKHTLRPEEEILTVDGERLTLSRPARHETRTLDLTEQPEIGALVDTVRGTLSGDLTVLQAHYSVGLEGTLAAWRLTLVPIDARMARFLRVVRIDGSGNTLRTIETVQANNDTTRMTVTAAQ